MTFFEFPFALSIVQLYFRRSADDHAHSEDNSTTDHAQLEATIAELKHNQANMMKLLKEQNETNLALREYITKSQLYTTKSE